MSAGKRSPDGMTADPKHIYTLDEYFDLDRASEERYEYWDGQVFCMSGVSEIHDLIETNLVTLLSNKLQRPGCRVFSANMRIKVPSLPPYRYADLSVLCGKPVFEKIGGVDALTNPVLIVEVLSESTEAYDRGDKFTHYKSIESFSEYLLVAQHRPHVTQYAKQDDGSWLYRELNRISDRSLLSSVGCALDLAEIYRDVNFAGLTLSLQPNP